MCCTAPRCSGFLSSFTSNRLSTKEKAGVSVKADVRVSRLAVESEAQPESGRLRVQRGVGRGGREQDRLQPERVSHLRRSVLDTQSQAVDDELDAELHIVHKEGEQSAKERTPRLLTSFPVKHRDRTVSILLRTKAQLDAVLHHVVDVAAVLFPRFS